MSTVPELRTRRPSGKPPWPLILLAGAEKCGKSYSAAAFSASDLVDRTFWIEIGEGAADQYGALPGARYEIVEHDGTYQGIGRAIYAATLQPREDGRPHAIVVDSMTELWDLLSDEAQQAANKRKGKGSDGEAQITMDLWNVAKKRWRKVIDLLRTYDGPVILTSRLEQVSVMSPSGQPTTAKTLKIRAEKNLGYEVDAIVQIPEPRQYQLTGVRSVHWNRKPGEAMDYPDFTVDALLRKLGLAEADATQARSYTAPRVEVDEQREAPAAPGAAPMVREPEPHRPRGAERSNRAEGGEWEQSAPAKQIDDAEVRMISDGQKKALHALIAQKYGPKTDAERHASFSKFTKREITSANQLTYAEASAYIDVLNRQPDFVKPPHDMGAAMVAEHAKGVRYEALLAAIKRANETDLDRLLSDATASRDAGEILPEHWDALSTAANGRAAEIVSAMADAGQERPGFSHRMLADQGAAL